MNLDNKTIYVYVRGKPRLRHLYSQTYPYNKLNPIPISANPESITIKALVNNTNKLKPSLIKAFNIILKKIHKNTTDKKYA